MYRGLLVLGLVFILAVGLSKRYKSGETIPTSFSSHEHTPLSPKETERTPPEGFSIFGEATTFLSWVGVGLGLLAIYPLVIGIGKNCAEVKAIVKGNATSVDQCNRVSDEQNSAPNDDGEENQDGVASDETNPGREEANTAPLNRQTSLEYDSSVSDRSFKEDKELSQKLCFEPEVCSTGRHVRKGISWISHWNDPKDSRFSGFSPSDSNLDDSDCRKDESPSPLQFEISFQTTGARSVGEIEDSMDTSSTQSLRSVGDEEDSMDTSSTITLENRHSSLTFGEKQSEKYQLSPMALKNLTDILTKIDQFVKKTEDHAAGKQAKIYSKDYRIMGAGDFLSAVATEESMSVTMKKEAQDPQLIGYVEGGEASTPYFPLSGRIGKKGVEM